MPRSRFRNAFGLPRAHCRRQRQRAHYALGRQRHLEPVVRVSLGPAQHDFGCPPEAVRRWRLSGCGFDGHKRVKERERHILVDTLGLIIANRVEPAGISDQRAGTCLLGGLRPFFPVIRTVMADAGHQSRKLARPLNRHEGWSLVITKRGQRALKIKGLTWIVERSFAWLGRNRRLSQDYEHREQTSETLDRRRRDPLHAQPPCPSLTLLAQPLSFDSCEAGKLASFETNSNYYCTRLLLSIWVMAAAYLRMFEQNV